MEDEPEPIEIPITGELDLHTFSPRETARVLDAYFEACQERGIFTVRVIHGKGTGALRRTVHAHLNGHPLVENFSMASAAAGGWGATWVMLRADPNNPRRP